MNSKAPLEGSSPASKFLILMGLFLVCFVVFQLLGILVAMPFAHISGLYELGKLSDYTNPGTIMGLKMAQIVSAIGAFIVPSFLFAMLVSKKKFAYLGLNVSPTIIALLLAGSIMIIATPFINWMAEINSHLTLPASLSSVENWIKDSEAKATAITNAFLADKSIGGLFLNLFIVAALAAFSEEIFFRGVLQKTIINWTKNVHWGVWISGIVFSTLHFEFYGFLPRMMMGVFLGYIYVWSKSLWVPMFAHFINNGMDVLLSFFEQRNVLPKNIDQAGSAVSDWWQVVASVLLIALLLFVFYKLVKKDEKSEAIK